MKRLLIGAVAMLVLALPMQTGARETTFDTRSAARQAPEPGVSFVLKTRNGVPRKVNKFAYEDLFLQCDQGGVLLSSGKGKFPSMTVTKKGTFGGKFASPDGNEKIDVTGKLKRKGRVAEGTLRARGTFVASDGTVLTGCDSGKADWKSKRG